MARLTRRQLLIAAAATGTGTLLSPLLSSQVFANNKKPVVAALFCGHIDDNGFM